MAAAVGVSTTPPRGSRKARARAVAPAVLAAEEAMDVAKHSTDPTDMANSLRSPSASVRLAALKRLCPCKLRESAGRDEFEPVWSAIFALATDDDARIRAQTLHTICDGSPSCYEDRVKSALEMFNRDADKKIRRQAHKVLASLTRTGKWNIL